MTTATIPAWCDPTLSREERIAAVNIDWWRVAYLWHWHTCCLCGHSVLRHIVGEDRYGIEIQYGECDACQVKWHSARPSSEWYANFYASGTYRKLVSAYHGRDVMATIREEQEEYAKRLWPRIIKHGLPYSVLDIGSSTGAVSKHWYENRNKRIAVTLVDPAASESAFGGKCSSYAELFETADLSGDQYECILLCQTIDHLLEPRACLEKIRGLLAPDGLFFIDILDTEQEVAQKGWQQTLKIDHPFYFTDKSARLLLAATGFEIVDSWESARNHIGYLCKSLNPNSSGSNSFVGA